MQRGNRDEGDRAGEGSDGAIRVGVEQRSRGALQARPWPAAEERDIDRALVNRDHARDAYAEPEAVWRESRVPRPESRDKQPVEPQQSDKLRNRDVENPALDLRRGEVRPRVERADVAQRPEAQARFAHD